MYSISPNFVLWFVTVAVIEAFVLDIVTSGIADFGKTVAAGSVILTSLVGVPEMVKLV